jgi:hypothetical protein
VVTRMFSDVQWKRKRESTTAADKDEVTAAELFPERESLPSTNHFCM